MTFVDAAEYLGSFVVWGIGLSAVCWTLGYLVWFIVQIFR